MMELDCREIARATGGKMISGEPHTMVKGVSIDSRTLMPGEWFVPLQGENTDGHNFVEEVLQKGAAGSFFTKPCTLDAKSLPGTIIEVEDTLEALQDMAGYYRRKFSPQVIGVTGSSGKTTTKDLLASILKPHLKVLKTEGNYNNQIGLPLTLMNLTAEHEAAVLEMGMNRTGEIDKLTRISKPGWGIITNIGEAHIELLGSRDNIARAKGELINAMGDDGIIILNGDDPYLREMGESFGGKVYYYGWEEGADFKGNKYTYKDGRTGFEVSFPGGERKHYYLPLPGKHNASNALAALSVGYLLGVEIDKLNFELTELDFSGGRMQMMKSVEGAKIINDSYNANPDSMKASLEVLEQMEVSGARIAVLGDMFELGIMAEEAHREVGRKIARSKIDYLVAVGELARYIAEEARQNQLQVYICRNKEEAWKCLRELPRSEGNCFLVKGSRGMNLEELVAKLTKGAH